MTFAPKKTSHRVERMEDLIRKEVAQYLLEGVKDPRIGFVTITRVEMTKDLENAKIYFSVYGSEKEKNETIEALEEDTKRVRHHLGTVLKIRHTPRVQFVVDEGLEASLRVNELLSQTKK